MTKLSVILLCFIIVGCQVKSSTHQEAYPDPYQYLRSNDLAFQAGIQVGVYNRLNELCRLYDEEVRHIKNVIFYKYKSFAESAQFHLAKDRIALASVSELMTIVRVRRSYSSFKKACRAEVRRAVKESNVYDNAQKLGISAERNQTL